MNFMKFYAVVVFLSVGIISWVPSFAGSSEKNSEVSEPTHLDTSAWIVRLKSSDRAKTWQLLLNASSQDFVNCTAWGGNDVNNHKGSKLVEAWMFFLSNEASLDLPKNETDFKYYINNLIGLSGRFGREGSLQSLLMRDAIYRIAVYKCAKFVLAHPHSASFVKSLNIKTLTPFSRAEIRRVIPNNINRQLHKKYIDALSRKTPELLQSVMDVTDPPADSNGFPDIRTSEIISQQSIAGLVFRLAQTQAMVKVQLLAFCDYIANGGTLKELENYDVYDLLAKIRKTDMKYSCPLFGIKHTRPSDIILASRWVESDSVPSFIIDALR